MISITAEAIREAFSEFLKEAWDLDHDVAVRRARRPLADKAKGVREQILSSAIKEHPLYPIIVYILDDMIDHCEAVDLLGKRKGSLLHARHIEEVYTVAKFLLAEKGRHQEFGWRWNNFQELHRIRSRVLNFKKPLDEDMVGFLEANIHNMKAYFHPKFEVDETKCISLWEKLTNWMMPITLKDVFEKVGRTQSYVSAAYDWNSQAVHLSPLGNQYIGYELEHIDFGDFAHNSVKMFVRKLCHECAPIVAEQDKLRDYYFQEVMLETYEMLVIRPDQYINLVTKGGRYVALTEEILRKPFRMDRVRNVAIGAPPVDPYVLNFPAPAAGAATSEKAGSSPARGTS